MSSHEIHPLPAEVEALLASERSAPDPSDETRRRVRARVEGSLGLLGAAAMVGAVGHTAAATTAAAGTPAIGVTALGGAGAAAASAPATLLSLTAVKLAVWVAAAAAVGGGAYAVHRIAAPPPIAERGIARVTPHAPRVAATERAADPLAPTQDAPSATALVAPPVDDATPRAIVPAAPVAARAIAPTAPVAAPAIAGASPRVRDAPAPWSVTVPAVPLPPPGAPAPATQRRRGAPGGPLATAAVVETPDELAAERLLLDGARSALARGASDQTLHAVAEHARRFPSGKMVEEREILWIEALVSLGERTEARARAAEFRRDFPRSIFLPTVDAALKLFQ